MTETVKYKINQLKATRERLVREFNSLLYDYQEYKRFFRKEDGPKAREEANMRYYSYMMDLLEVGPYEEGRFSLEHQSLNSKIKENKDARNEIVKQIKQIKDQIKAELKRSQA